MFCELFRRSPGAGQQFAAAIRAAALQPRLGAGCAECAVERTDACIGRIGRQVLVAALAIRAQFEHGTPRAAQLGIAERWKLTIRH